MNTQVVTGAQALAQRKVKMFLRFLAETGRVDYAAKCAGFADTNFLYKRKKADKDLADAWDEALEIAGDRFEAEAARRAVDGVEKPVFYKGEVVGYEVQYSDSLLAKLLDGSKPGKYRHNVTEIKGEIKGSIGIAILPMTAKNVEDWERDCISLHPNHAKIIEGEIKLVEDNRSPSVVRA